MLAGTSNTDVQQPALFLNVFGGLRVTDRQGSFLAADHEHGVPLQTLRRVQRRQRDSIGGWNVLNRGSGFELTHHVG
jgi:hypothetical protein